MKKQLLFLLALCFSTFLSAQGTLQFNNAVLLEGNQSTCTACWTVPAGKVWKVTSISSNHSGIARLFINGRELSYMSRYSNGTEAYWLMDFPFWLPSGTTLGYNGLSSNRNITFFALEFNVVP